MVEPPLCMTLLRCYSAVLQIRSFNTLKHTSAIREGLNGRSWSAAEQLRYFAMMFRTDVHHRRYGVSKYLLWSLILLFLVGFRWFWSDDVRTRDDVDALISQKYPLVKNISVEELRSLFAKNSKFYLFDVRDPEEFAVSHLHNAVREVKAEKVELPGEVLIIAYCSVGMRSAAFVDDLQERGYHQAYNLQGSLFEWANKGYPLEQNGKNTHKAHPYNSAWGVFLDSKLHSFLPDKTGNDL